MKQLLLFAGLALVLLGAFLVQRQLTAPIEPPPVTQVQAPPPRVEAPPPRVEAPPPPSPSPSPAPSSPVEPPPALARAPSVIPPPPVEARPAALEPENAFTADNAREIEYAFQLAVGPSSTVETAKNAAEVFERCLKQFPTNTRCLQGLEAAQHRIQDTDWKPRNAPPPVLLGNHPPRPGPPPRGLPAFGQVRTRLPVRPEEPEEPQK